MKELTTNAKKVLETRYLIRDEKGNLTEGPQQLFERVAKAVASAENIEALKSHWENEFYSLMSNLDFMPNTPTLLNAGREGKYSVLSACFVLPIEDTLDGIFTTLYRSAILHQSGAGTGYSFSRLRPEGSTVSRKTGVSSGPVSFMKVFNAAVEEIKQGNTRRGALMMILNCDHPDIFKFIECKMDETQIRNANISVAVTDKFMEAVENNSDWVLSHPKSSETKTIKARDLWDKIIDCAWAKGDPGLFFIDEANKYNPVPHVYQIESTNPCGEVPMGPNEACNLGSINLVNFVNKQSKSIDWVRLKEVIRTSVRFLDNVISISRLPFPEMDKMVKGNRKIGLGVMGWADVLITLGIRYDSDQALDLANQFGSFLQKESDQMSIELGLEKGSFPNFKGSIYDGKFPALRNCTRTVIAPTGTISLICNETSSGVEPVFAFRHKSNRMDTQMSHNHWFVNQWEKENPSKPLPDYCVESHQIDPTWHINTQAVWQKYINDAVSKTINMPNSATKEDISNAYKLAWTLKTKGVTIFRDGCRSTGQVLETEITKAILNGSNPSKNAVESKIKEKTAYPTSTKPFGHDSKYYEVTSGFGPLHVHIDHKNGDAYRVFCNTPPLGTEISGLVATLGVVISKFLEKGGKLEDLIKHLASVTGDRPIGFGEKRIQSIPHALSTMFKDFVEKYSQEPKVIPKMEILALHCPECYSSQFTKQEGCSLCHSCGFSSCG